MSIVSMNGLCNEIQNTEYDYNEGRSLLLKSYENLLDQTFAILANFLKFQKKTFRKKREVQLFSLKHK